MKALVHSKLNCETGKNFMHLQTIKKAIMSWERLLLADAVVVVVCVMKNTVGGNTRPRKVVLIQADVHVFFVDAVM